MVFESYPQLILNIFIMEGLQIQEWFNITSCAISALSVLYGTSDFLVTIIHNKKKGMDIQDIPFSKTLWGMLTIVIDTFLRALSIAYLMTFIRAYLLFLPLLYFLLMVMIVFIKYGNYHSKKWDKL